MLFDIGKGSREYANRYRYRFNSYAKDGERSDPGPWATIFSGTLTKFSGRALFCVDISKVLESVSILIDLIRTRKSERWWAQWPEPQAPLFLVWCGR
jgi:hypothetical protein